MRVLVVTTSYPRFRGDPAGSFVGGFARWLARRGDDVQVIAAAPGEDRDGDVPVRRVAGGGDLFYGSGAPEALAASWPARAAAPVFTAALAAEVARAGLSRWDAIVSHWLAPCGLACAPVCGARRFPHLAVAHSGDVHLLARPGVADGAVAALLASGARVAFAGAHLRERLLAALAAAPLRRALEARSMVSPMGIDAAELGSVARPEARGLRPVVGFLGRLVPIKGVAVLIDACALLGDVELRAGGDGPERAALEDRARAAGVRARFLGELRGDARRELFAACDVLALPSIDLPGGRTEGTPVVALEALAAGVPLCASDVGGVRAAVRDAAWLVPPGDPAALAAALREALADPSRARKGPEIAKDYDWSRVGDTLMRFLLE